MYRHVRIALFLGSALLVSAPGAQRAAADVFCEDFFGFEPAEDRLVGGVPDISQVNDAFPGGGAAYCGPTSVGDWTWYLSRHGYPELVNEDWDQTEVVRQLGSAAYMGTDPEGGTGPEALRLGWWRYLDFPYPGCFDVVYRGLDKEDECIAFDKLDDFITAALAFGNYPVVRVGYYNEATGARRGGHYMAVVGYSVGEDGAVSLEVNDPSLNADSTDSYPLEERLLDGETRIKVVGRSKTIDGVVHPNYIDGAAVAHPRRVLAFEDDGLVLRRACAPTLPSTLSVGRSIAHAAFLPFSTTILGTAVGGTNVGKLDLATGKLSVFAGPGENLVSPGALVIDRRGHVWVANDGSSQYSVVELDAAGRFLQGISRSALDAASDLASDLVHDRVYAIDGTKDRIVSLRGPGPCAIPTKHLAGETRLAVLPDGRLVYHSDAEPTIHVLTFSPTGCAATERVFGHADLSDPHGLFTDEAGRIYVGERKTGNLLGFDPDGGLVSSDPDMVDPEGTLLAATAAPGASDFAPYPGDDVLEDCELTPDANGNGIPDGCEEPLVVAPRFQRGDANASGGMDIADSIYSLNYLFLGTDSPPCMDSADSNDDGAVDLTDPLFTLNYLFYGGREPPAPYAVCGPDPTEDELDCDRFPSCFECPDPDARRIEAEIISRTGDFTGRIRITGTVTNLGAAFDSDAGQQAVRLWEIPDGGDPRLVAEVEFVDLAPGESVVVTHETLWDTAFEFPPSYRLAISYDPDIFIDGNAENDDCDLGGNSRELRGAEIDALFE